MHVTVCICTRNRGESIAATLQSLLASTYRDFDVVIVDQSTNDDTARAVAKTTAGDARFHYVRSTTVGLSAARNIAVGQARGPLIAFTDDDCEVSPEWLSVLVDRFSRYPDVGEVCGMVRAAPHDPTAGHIPIFTVQREERIRSPWRMWRASGIGANMSFRREALQAAGPFDEMLGPGAALYNCDDLDMTYRVLRAGYSVLNTPDAYVLHSGFRPWHQGGKALIHRSYISIAASYMKHARAGDIAILPTLVYVWWVWCVSWKNIFLLRKAGGFGVRNFVYYAYGMLLSFRYRVDRQRRVYLPPQPRVTIVMNAAEPPAPLSD